MESKIKPTDVCFGDFHRRASELFYIPSLQRPYSWESKKQVDRLWEDIIDNQKPYYIGSIVSIAGSGSVSKDQIIDGQQRLTTLYLMIIAVRDYVLSLKDKNSKEILKKIEDCLVKYSSDDKTIRLSFSDEKSNLVYEAIVDSKINLKTFDSEIQKRFIKNFEYLKSKVNEYCGKGKYKLRGVEDILDRIYSLQIIFIKCIDKSAAFRLFESINATGIDLTTNDLIKNSIFESVYNDKKMLDYVENGWKEMSEEFNENSSYLKTYIRHHWISTVDYTSHSRLFDDFLEEYKDKEDVFKYSKSLFKLAPVYNAIKNGDTDILDKLPRNRNELTETKELLKFLGSLGVDQIYSVLLNIYNNNPDKFRKDLIRLSAFQFIFKYIPGSPSTPEKKFANFCSGKLDKSKLFNDLIKICEDKEKDFVNKIVEKTKYVSGNSIDVQFILEKYLYHLGPASKFADPTIEHILPQDKNDKIYKNIKTDFKTISKKIHGLGNLTILERAENSDKKLFNQEFSVKYPMYKDHLFDGNKKILKYNFDTDPIEAVNKRSKDLATVIYKIFMEVLKTGKWIKL